MSIVSILLCIQCLSMYTVCDLSNWPRARGQWKSSRASGKMTRTSEIFIRLLRPNASQASENKSQFCILCIHIHPK